MLIAIAPLFVAIIGLLMWLLLTHPKASEAGKILFTVGALWTVYALSGETIRL